jgi:hypothetical protein
MMMMMLMKLKPFFCFVIKMAFIFFHLQRKFANFLKILDFWNTTNMHKGYAYQLPNSCYLQFFLQEYNLATWAWEFKSWSLKTKHK